MYLKAKKIVCLYIDLNFIQFLDENKLNKSKYINEILKLDSRYLEWISSKQPQVTVTS